MTIAEKYNNLKCKSIEEMVIEIVEDCAKKCKNEQGLEICCGWWKDETKPKANDGQWFDLMSGECYHEEINQIMRDQGFKIYEDYGAFRHRARTYYRL